MSNEYKDYLQDSACDVLLDQGILKRIDMSDTFHGGFIILGYDFNFQKRLYFVWNDDIDGWDYREINI